MQGRTDILVPQHLRTSAPQLRGSAAAHLGADSLLDKELSSISSTGPTQNPGFGPQISIFQNLHPFSRLHIHEYAVSLNFQGQFNGKRSRTESNQAPELFMQLLQQEIYPFSRILLTLNGH